MNYQVSIESVSITGEAFVICKQFNPTAQYVFNKGEHTFPLGFNEWMLTQSVDIVIVCHDDFHCVKRCLKSVIDGIDKTLNYTIYVVNNACESYAEIELDVEVRGYQEAGIPIKLLTIKEYMGHLEAVALVTGHCKGSWLVLVDSKVLVAPGWLLGLLRAGCADDRVALVTPWSSKRVEPAPGETFQVTANKVWEYAKVSDLELSFPATFCIAIRREYFDKVGGWEDMNYAPGGGEVNDLFMRLHKDDKIAVRADDVYVWDDSPGLCESEWISSAANSSRFMNKWKDEARKLLSKKAGKDSIDCIASLITQVKIDNRPNIVFVLREAPICGMILAITHLCNGLAELGWNATFACTKLDFSTIRLLPMRFAPLVYQDRSELVASLRNTLHDADVVAPTWVTCKDVVDICEGNVNLRPLYFIQDDERQFRHPTGVPYGTRETIEETYRMFSRIIVNSDWVQDELRTLGITNAEKIGIGVDTAMFHPRFVSQIPIMRVMAHCRPSTPRRGWPFIATVMNACSGLFKFEFVTYDEMPEELSFEHVGHLGKVGPEELAREMSIAHVFFEGSELQGWGMQSLEAMASGCALISTANKGIDNYGTNGYDCIIIPYGDITAAVGIMKYLSDNLNSSEICQLQANARDTALAFDWSVVVKEWDLYLRRS